jgi:hypothetical protein
VLHRRMLRFILPIPVRGKSGGVRTLFHAASRKTIYTFKSPQHGELEVAAVVVFQRTLQTKRCSLVCLRSWTAAKVR